MSLYQGTPNNIYIERDKLKMQEYLDKVYFNVPCDPRWVFADTIARLTQYEHARMYLSDVRMYSDKIYDETLRTPGAKLLGKLRTTETCQVLKYLDYKDIWIKIQYLNKTFLNLWRQKFNYIQCDKSAVMRVSLKQVYEGKIVMPPLNHIYYKSCDQLKIIYQTNEGKDLALPLTR